MAKISVKFSPSALEGMEGKIFYRISHCGRNVIIPSGLAVYPDEWDEASHTPVIPDNTSYSRALRLGQIIAAVNSDTTLLRGLAAAELHRNPDASSADIAAAYGKRRHSDGFLSFARNLIGELRRAGRLSRASHFQRAVNCFVRFIGNDDPGWHEINPILMEGFEQHMLDRNLSPNTTSYYMRNMRRIYNLAVEQKLTPQLNPFRHVYTGIAKTRKRAAGIDVIRRIKKTSLAECPGVELARDIFMFSFYTRGMSFVDIAALRKSDVAGDRITYRRRKTHKELSLLRTKEIQDIIERHTAQSGPYLFPLIKDAAQDFRRQYLTASHRINVNLRKLGEKLDLGFPLTMYVARHSWASIARGSNIPLSTISEAMGHSSEKITRIYLSTLDYTAVDRANEIVSSMLD